MQIRYVAGTDGKSITPIPLIRIEMTIQEARDLEKGLLALGVMDTDDMHAMQGFISGMVAHLDEREIPSMPGLQESIELIDKLRKFIDGRGIELVVKKGEYEFTKEYLLKQGMSCNVKENVWDDTFRITRVK
jgi:hypothetical protein